MARWLWALFTAFAVCVMLWHCGGCAADKAEITLSYLERGQAEGHLTVTSSGAVEAGETISFFAGAKGTTIAFDGSIDFSKAPPTPPAWAGEAAANKEDEAPPEG